MAETMYTQLVHRKAQYPVTGKLVQYTNDSERAYVLTRVGHFNGLRLSG
jgi:hypothetical protein